MVGEGREPQLSLIHILGVFFCILIISNKIQLYHFGKNDIINVDNDINE